MRTAILRKITFVTVILLTAFATANPSGRAASSSESILPAGNAEQPVKTTVAVSRMAATFTDISPDNEGPSSGFFDCPDPCVSGRNGGRVNGLSAVPGVPAMYYAASELGGLFKIQMLADGSGTWQHLDGHLPTLTWDVAAAPGGQRVFATSFYEGRLDLTAALQVSTDGGNTWKGSLPDAPPTCSALRASEPSGFGIGLRPGTSEILVGTNCGLARTMNGDSWTRFDPTLNFEANSVWDVVALPGGLTYACGDDGLLVSASGAPGTWVALARPPATGSFCSLAVSPEESYVVFAMFGTPVLFGDLVQGAGGKLYQGVVSFDSTGEAAAVQWTPLPNPDPGGPKTRVPFVATNDRSAGYDLWAGIGNLVRGTCSTPATPPALTTARCTTWSETYTDGNGDPLLSVINAHGDSGTLVFNPSTSVDACPTFYSSDGGVYRNTLTISPACHAPAFEGKNQGLHAFMLWGMSAVRSLDTDAEDLYIVLQDNGLYSTANAGALAPDWTHGVGGDAYDVVADTNRVVATTSANLVVGDPGFTNVNYLISGYTGATGIAQAYVEPTQDHYFMIVRKPFDYPAGTSTPIGVREITDIEANPVGQPLGIWPAEAKVPCHIQAGMLPSGPQPYLLTDRGGSCILGRNDPGGNTANDLWTYRDGGWTQIPTPPEPPAVSVPAKAGFGFIYVDPKNANRLYASVVYDGPPRIMRSSNGGIRWTTDQALTDLMTAPGTFAAYPESPIDGVFLPYLQPLMVTFDPDDPNLIVAGGYNSGVFLSADDGASWSLLTDPFTPGTSGIPHLPRPLFAHFDHDKPGFVRIILGTGRGIWRVEIAEADLQITKTAAASVYAGESLTYTITVANQGPENASDVIVHDLLPAGVSYASSSDSCAESTAGKLSCAAGDLAVGVQTSFTINVNVSPDLVYLNGGPKTITNSATVSSGQIDPDLSDNTASADTLVKAKADLAIVSFAAAGAPRILVGQATNLTLRKVVTNHGPSAPMDAVLTLTSTAPPDASAVPAVSQVTIDALGLNELRTVDESFTLTCNGYSHHTFQFENQIQPANSADTDPIPNNNMASLNLDIECVVPIKIDVLPPVINLKSGGVVTVAVYANAAGEFGLPLAFDPASIVMESVRFGPRQLVWEDNGGAAATLGSDQANNTKRRNFHFRSDESNFVPGAQEACLMGTWLDANGSPHTFFGCDTVLVK